MGQPLFGFQWHTPSTEGELAVVERSVPHPKTFDECEDAYQKFVYWRGGGEAARLGDSAPEPVLMRTIYCHNRFYEPLRQEPGLFRVFADTRPDPEGCLAFARKYGMLGIFMWALGDADLEPGNLFEPVQAWQVRIDWLRYLITLWDLARRGSERSLAKFASWQDGKVIFRQAPAVRPIVRVGGLEPPPPSLTGDDDDPEDKVTLLPGDAIQPGKLAPAAKLFCLLAVSEELPDLAGPAMIWDRDTQAPCLQVMPDSLWGAILLQFAMAMDGDKQYHRCPVCGRWFELSPGVNRADKQTCSGTCRTGLHRRRRQRAAELHAQGKTLKKIAKDLGVTVELVEKWLSKEKG